MSLFPPILRVAARVPAFAAVALVAPSVASGEIRTLASDNRHVVVEIRPEAAEVTPVRANGRDYVQLSIPEMGLTDRAGEPELPASSVRIAVPPNTIPRLRIRQAQWTARAPGAVRPCPERIGVRDPFGPSRVVERDAEEDERYRGAVVHPAQPFALSEVKGLRDLRVVELRYFGAQAETFARGYRLLERAVLEVTFEPVATRSGRQRAERPVVPGELWQRTYKSGVLNPQQAAAWARGGPGDALSVGNAPWGGGDQWKVEVSETGLWEIPFSALRAAGFRSGVPVAHVSVYQRVFDLDHVDDPAVSADSLFHVLPVPVVMRDRNGNGVFDDPDGVVLWGRSVRDQWMTSGWEHEDTHDVRNFVFVREDPTGGARMTTRPGVVPDSGADSLVCTPSEIFREQDLRYSQYAPDFGPGKSSFETEFYYWNHHTTSTGGPDGWWFSDPFTITDLVADSAATLTARICPTGGSSRLPYYRNTNIVRFEFNGQFVADRRFYNPSLYSGGVVDPNLVLNVHSVPGALLNEGANTFDFRAWSYTGDGISEYQYNARFLFDWYRLEYPRQLVARGDHLRLDTSKGTSAPQRIRVRGFSGGGVSDLFLFDVTSPEAPVSVSLDPMQLVGGTDLRFSHDNATGVGEYVAVRDGAIPKLTSVTAVARPTLLAGGAGTSYAVVAHDLFEAGARELAAYRAERYPGAVAAVLSEVYDVFGGGRIHPDAIKAYAAYAFHRWENSLVFLCLIGDASEDHRGAGGDAAPDLLPSHSLWSEYEGTTEETDQYYAEVTRSGSGFDDLSDLYVGRLAVSEPEELDWNIRRMREYESPEDPDELWRRRALLLADDALSGDLGATAGSGYGWTRSELDFCRRSRDFATLLEAHPTDALIPDIFCWSDFSHPCPDDCNSPSSGNCEDSLGIDCGIWYDCRIFPYDVANWRVEWNCQRAAVKAEVYPRLQEKLNDGVLLWNFQGHANKYFLGHEEVWRDDNSGRNDVSYMANEGKPFIFLGFACHLSEFDRDDEGSQGDCMAEKMMNLRQDGMERPGGCVASFASSGYEFLAPNLNFNEYVLQAFYFPGQLQDEPSGQGLPDDGDANAYVWTLGEATTRSRLLFQERYSISSELFRAAARRFILLGDPALSPDVSSPSIQVTVNGRTVEDPSQEFYAPPDDFPGVNRVVVTATESRGVSRMRVVDSALGEVDPANYEVTTEQQTAHGVPQVRTLSYDFQLRPGTAYELAFEAIDGSGQVAQFVMRTDPRFTFVGGEAAVYPNPFRQNMALVFRLSARAHNATMGMYSIAGRKILERSLGGLAANEQIEVHWDGRDEQGLPVANGTYFLRLKLEGTAGTIETTYPVVRMR